MVISFSFIYLLMAMASLRILSEMCIRDSYKDFLKKRDAFTADEILGHNLEDVLGLGRIFDMLGYLCIYDGDYEVTYSEFDGDNPVSYTHLDVYKRQVQKPPPVSLP